MGSYIGYNIKLFAQFVGAINAGTQRSRILETVIPYPQRIAGLSCIYGICTVGKCGFEMFRRARRGKQFRSVHGGSRGRFGHFSEMPVSGKEWPFCRNKEGIPLTLLKGFIDYFQLTCVRWPVRSVLMDGLIKVI